MAKELAYVDRQDLVDTADALRERLSTTDTYGTSEFADAVREIQGGVDTSDANATEMDIVERTNAYVNGIKVNGTLGKLQGFDVDGVYDYGDGLVMFTTSAKNRGYLDNGELTAFYTEINQFGTAPRNAVLVGNTFTSAAGLSTEGTLVVNKYYTGSTTPSSSLGNNGDLYLMVPASDPIDDDNKEV